MSSATRRTVIRVIVIGVQWIFLTIALGALAMRSDTSFDDVLSPHLGAGPMFVGAIVAAFLLGLTIESFRVLAPLVLLMCVTAAAFIGVLTYAPVVDGILIRTNSLDNFVVQRVLIMTLLMMLASIPGATAGNLLGSFLNVRQEIMVHPEDLAPEDEVPWWERRGRSRESHPSD